MKQPKPTVVDVTTEIAARKGYTVAREPSGLIGVYGRDGKRYGAFDSWNKTYNHMRYQAKPLPKPETNVEPTRGATRPRRSNAA
jgi:hypothetical protein